MKNVEIIGGGTVSHVRNHLALCAPAYGTTARKLEDIILQGDINGDYYVNLHLTRMADHRSRLETNEDVSKLIDTLIVNPNTRIIFFNPALVDYDGCVTTEDACGYDWDYNIPTTSGKYETRLKTSEGRQKMILTPSAKIL